MQDNAALLGLQMVVCQLVDLWRDRAQAGFLGEYQTKLWARAYLEVIKLAMALPGHADLASSQQPRRKKKVK